MVVAWTMTKAWLLGLALLVAGHLLWWGVLLDGAYSEALRVALFFVPAVAAFLVAYLAPRRKLLLGISMGLCGALIGFAAMAGYEHLGYHIDKIGGPLATLAILLAIHLGYSSVGSIAGYFTWRIRSRATA
jgi:hypothetical protein